MGQETQAMDIRPESVLWSDESKFYISGSNRRVFVRCRVGEWMISACMVSTVKHGGGGVMVWGCFAGDTVSDLFRIQGTQKYSSVFVLFLYSHILEGLTHWAQTSIQ